MDFDTLADRLEALRWPVETTVPGFTSRKITNPTVNGRFRDTSFRQAVSIHTTRAGFRLMIQFPQYWHDLSPVLVLGNALRQA